LVDVVAVFGISGVGKSWLVSRLAERRGMRHVQAGELLRLEKEKIEGRSTSAEELRKGAVLDNQTLLLRAFEKACAAEPRDVLFDGHSVVDTDTGLVEVPVSVIKGLGPKGIVFVSSEPREIAARRFADSSRMRPQRSINELAAQQEVALRVCKNYSLSLNISCFIVASGDLEGLDQAVGLILTNLIS